jgi:hypothetical protein
MGPGKERAPWNQLIESVVTVWIATTLVVVDGLERGGKEQDAEKLYVCRELEKQ